MAAVRRRAVGVRARRSITAFTTIFNRLVRSPRPEFFRRSRPKMAKIVQGERAVRRRIEEPRAAALENLPRSGAGLSRSSTFRKGPGRASGPCRSIARGEFIDLCRGPHVPGAGHDWRVQAPLPWPARIGKVTNRGSNCSGLYGTAWFSKADLDKHLEQVEEAKRRGPIACWARPSKLFPHRPRSVGSGLVLWLPKGATIRGPAGKLRQGKSSSSANYQPVYTPNIGRLELYQIFGALSVLRRQPIPAADRSPAGPLRFSSLSYRNKRGWHFQEDELLAKVRAVPARRRTRRIPPGDRRLWKKAHEARKREKSRRSSAWLGRAGHVLAQADELPRTTL